MPILNRSLLRLLLAAVLAVFASPATSAQTPEERAAQVADAVDKHYNDLKSLKANFVESYRGAGLARTESGTLTLKRGGKMRWDYTEPRTKLFVTDGKTAYFYVPGERQARKTEMKKLDDLRSPLRFLLGRTKLKKELEQLTLSREAKPSAPENVVLRGVPKHLADRVAQVLIEVNPKAQIVRLHIEELDGSTTEFRFSDLVENVTLADSQFRFTPPAQVEVIEATEIGP